LFPKSQLTTLIEMSNIPIPRLSYDDFDLDDKLEQYSKILKKKLIYDIEDYRLVTYTLNLEIKKSTQHI
jgi:hypothetical protein